MRADISKSTAQYNSVLQNLNSLVPPGESRELDVTAGSAFVQTQALLALTLAVQELTLTAAAAAPPSAAPPSTENALERERTETAMRFAMNPGVKHEFGDLPWGEVEDVVCATHGLWPTEAFGRPSRRDTWGDSITQAVRRKREQ